MEFLNAFSNMDWNQVMHLTLQHIALVGIAVTLAIVVGVPLGVLMTRFPSLAGPMQASATVLLTIPSIALFGLLLPFYSKFGQGLGPMPAITAVFLYSLLPIMRNTYLALTGVEPGIREAARGIGMTFGQRLRMVELPIAVPVILAGHACGGGGRLAAAAVAQQADAYNSRHGQRSHALADLILFHCFILLVLGCLCSDIYQQKRGSCSFGKQLPLAET